MHCLRGGFLDSPWICSKQTPQQQLHLRKFKPIVCSFTSFSNGNDKLNKRAGSCSRDDDDYVRSTLLETVEVNSVPGGLLIETRDGTHLKCVRNNPLLDEPVHPSPRRAIVLKMEDHTKLLLPLFFRDKEIIPGTVRTDKLTMHHVMKHMLQNMDYKAECVRITVRIDSTYCAELLIGKKISVHERERFSFDIRPFDAINISSTLKVPIQVNKYLAFCDGVRVLNQMSL
ncbi:hypothetical protein M569_04911 [Genlisea aurea]|uniref:BFN domain-containing protein n=1 Tax=Genlisea aurea TaxID=192259 RepID=S8EBH5_9LAMI|nr:hypothetical protein M569_04911 [Genlisea aurea]